PVDGTDQYVGRDVGQEQVGVAGLEATVAADVQVPAVLRRDDAEVLAPRLRALAGAAGHGRLHLLRRAPAPVPPLPLHRHAARVLSPVAAPRRPDAGRDGTQRLAVRVARLEAGVDQPAPDLR